MRAKVPGVGSTSTPEACCTSRMASASTCSISTVRTSSSVTKFLQRITLGGESSFKWDCALPALKKRTSLRSDVVCQVPTRKSVKSFLLTLACWIPYVYLTVSKSVNSPCTCSATAAAGQFSLGSSTFNLIPIVAYSMTSYTWQRFGIWPCAWQRTAFALRSIILYDSKEVYKVYNRYLEFLLALRNLQLLSPASFQAALHQGLQFSVGLKDCWWRCAELALQDVTRQMVRYWSLGIGSTGVRTFLSIG